MYKQELKRFFRSLTKQQKLFLLAAALVFVGLCFVLEITGVMDAILRFAGINDTVPLPANGTLEAHFIDVGNADACFVTCDGKTLLIDAGDKGTSDAVVDYLRDHGVKKLDYVIATHADADHIGGMRQVVSTFPVGEFLMAFMPEGFEPTTSTYLNLLNELDEQNIAVTDVRPNDTYPLGEAVITILGPVADSEDKNEQSVVCRVTHGAQRFLFTGDAGREEESSLLAAGVDLRADVLKVGHHGSSTSSTAEFLQAVEAEIGIVSCGEGNDYGHPHKEAVQRLSKAGVTLYRTDRQGTVIVRSDGDTLTVETET